MKKLFVILVVAMGLSMTAGAQSRAIGVRTGMLSYERYFGDPNFVELNVGWDYTGILEGCDGPVEGGLDIDGTLGGKGYPFIVP